MKAWLKLQLTEVSAWAGLFLIMSHWMPYWATITLGVLAISTDDTKATELAKKVGAWFGAKMDEVA